MRHVDEETFQTMLDRYNDEKNMLEKNQAMLKGNVQQTRDTEKNIDLWMEAVKQAVNIEKLSRSLLASLISRIVVHEREKTENGFRQRVDIYYKFVGNIPETE